MTPSLLDAQCALLARRMEALRDPDLVVDDWADSFIAGVCHGTPNDLTARQAAWIDRLCWTYRAQRAPEVVPAQEPPRPPARNPGEIARRFR
jgi:hypothetical protein